MPIGSQISALKVNDLHNHIFRQGLLFSVRSEKHDRYSVVIWRLGKDGDFTTASTDPSPWFSYQHNVHYLDNKTLLLFDNGNVRCFGDKKCHSRGQTWIIDEKTLTATPGVNVDLGSFSDALGSAERLPNGNFVFTAGSRGSPNAPVGLSIEIGRDGTKEFVMVGSALEYRSYRMADLYQGIHK
jgi:hypothetical protein